MGMESSSQASASASASASAGKSDHHGEQEDDTKKLRNAEILLRLLPLSLSLAAFVLMLNNSQSNDFGSISYSDVGAFRTLLHSNAICAGYSLFSAVVSAFPRPSTMSRAWTFFLLDQGLTYTLLGAGAIAAEVVYLAYKGDAAITWAEACGSIGSFCHKATASLAITVVVGICYATLSLISSYKLFTSTMNLLATLLQY